MRLREVELLKPSVAILRWETTRCPLEQGKGTLVFRDFENSEFMQLDYLDAVCETENVSVLCCDWLPAPKTPEAADVADQIRVKIEEAEKNLRRLEGELAQICALQSESPNPTADSVDDEVATQDDSVSDDAQRATTAREEEVRVEKLRSEKYNEVQIARKRLETLREQYNELTPQIETLPTKTPDRSSSNQQNLTRVITLTYYNLTGVREATFLVSTECRNVEWSRSFIATIPSLYATSSRCSEVLTIEQSTGVDWDNCLIRALGWEDPNFLGRSFVIRPAPQFRASCRSNIPFTHYFEPVKVAVELEEHFDLNSSRHVMWNVRFKFEETSPLPDSLKFELHLAGRFAGTFRAQRSSHTQGYTREIRNVMEDSDITAQPERINIKHSHYTHLCDDSNSHLERVYLTNIGKSRTVTLRVKGYNLQTEGPDEEIISIRPGSTQSCIMNVADSAE